MNIQQLQALVVDALEDVKAQDIQLFDTTHLSNMFDRLVVASGTSNRQTRALASSVHDKVKAAGGQVLGMEGGDTGEWVLVDLGDMVVHIMQAPIRAYYRLEELWGEKPVSLEVAKKGLKAAKAGKKSAKEEAQADADADASATAPGPLTLTKPKRASRRNDSAVEALIPEPKPRKSRSKAAASEPDASAPAPVKRTRKPAAAAAGAPESAPVKRVRTSAAKPAAEGAAKPAARPRKPRVAE